MSEEDRFPVFGFARIGLVVLLIVLVVFAIIFALTMVVIVGVGHAVVLVDPIAKSTSAPILGPTYAVKAPWVSAVDIYYATDSYESTVPCFSSDQLEMQIGILIRWSLNPAKITELYNNYPNLNYKGTAIESILEETIRLITKNYTALETIEFRDVVRSEIETTVIEELQIEPSLAGALMRLEFDLKNIGYPAKYTSAIEDKLVAEQQQIQADFEREKILILANATAQEIIIKASGEAQAKVIEANATRQAIELVLESVGQTGNETRIAELYLWVQTLQRIAPEVQILIVGTDGTPVLIPTNPTTP
ncbi:MAG: SPFH domain-containing protein [Candidatus Bathyarchaeota archaeon]|nr:SPFH domain-containing protein [Candidatus Bathyarchaeota archaeon]MDH5746577.1 SPFH domain-containing protein [Candidatus Bathyarchaeota archaeon]